MNQKEIISRKIKNEGMYNIAFKAINLILSKILIVEKILVFQLDLEKGIPKTNENILIEVKEAREEDIKKLDDKKYCFDRNSKKYLINRLRKGDICVLGIHKNEVVSYLWAMKNHIEITPYKIVKLPKNKSYSYNGFVLPEFRGNKIHTIMINHLYNKLRKEGKKIVLSGVSKKNNSALKTKNRQKGMYKIIGFYWSIHIFGIERPVINKTSLNNILSNKKVK